MKWLAKKREEVLRKWRNNEISMADAIIALADLERDGWAILPRV